MNTRIKKQIIELARATQNEICGFIYYTAKDGNSGELKIYPAHNISTNPTQDFWIDPVDYLRCDRLGTICGVYHSHPDETEGFSPADFEYMDEVAVPQYLYTVGTDKWQEYIPQTYHVNLVGLPFIWGLYDCYSIVKNGWRQECGVYLSDYDRDETFAQDSFSKNLIINSLANEGAEIVGRGMEGLGKIQKNDVILFNTESRERVLPVHFGLFQGNSRFIHHPENHLSRTDFLDEHWIQRVNLVIRHKTMGKTV